MLQPYEAARKPRSSKRDLLKVTSPEKLRRYGGRSFIRQYTHIYIYDTIGLLSLFIILYLSIRIF